METLQQDPPNVPFLFQNREDFSVRMGGTTTSNVSAATGRASETGPDD